MGLAQGFATFMNERKSGVEMSADAAKWLDTAGAKPFFLFVNYMDAHRPYNAAPLSGEQAARMPSAPAEPSPQILDTLYEQIFGSDAPPDPALLAKLVDGYDVGIANADAGLGALFDALKSRGLFENALVIVTADHGEYLGEKDLVEHSKDVYEPALRVPFVVKRPGQSTGRVIEEPISLADVPALVLGEQPDDLRERQAAHFPGTAGTHGMFAEIRYSRAKDCSSPWGKRFDRERSALYLERWKVIRSSDGRNELYDLAADPHEEHDLFTARPREAQLLLDTLERIQAKASKPGARVKPRDPTPEELEELRKLGYVDGK
jgi:arylsulfatase A-like enzyme